MRGARVNLGPRERVSGPTESFVGHYNLSCLVVECVEIGDASYFHFDCVTYPQLLCHFSSSTLFFCRQIFWQIVGRCGTEVGNIILCNLSPTSVPPNVLCRAFPSLFHFCDFSRRARSPVVRSTRTYFWGLTYNSLSESIARIRGHACAFNLLGPTYKFLTLTAQHLPA